MGTRKIIENIRLDNVDFIVPVYYNIARYNFEWICFDLKQKLKEKPKIYVKKNDRYFLHNRVRTIFLKNERCIVWGSLTRVKIQC